VHSQGGILLEHPKKIHLHVDAQEGDRSFWFTTTGWMMWHSVVGCLPTPASIVLYDGNPGSPDMGALWDLAEKRPAGRQCGVARLAREPGVAGLLRRVRRALGQCVC
jgi:acyl-coenzyme A synthetase/AMP-(fatty) acid ligase